MAGRFHPWDIDSCRPSSNVIECVDTEAGRFTPPDRSGYAALRCEASSTGHLTPLVMWCYGGHMTITVTLQDGTQYSGAVKRLPRNWKSYAMRFAPGLTDFRGCTFSVTK